MANKESPSATTNETSNWSKLIPELLQLIVSRLSYGQILRFQLVCSSWHRAVESCLSSSFYTPFPETPWVIIPTQDSYAAPCSFYSLDDNTKYTFKNMANELKFYDDCLIGSSHGWLILMKSSHSIPFLFNPFSKSRIALPSLHELPFLGLQRLSRRHAASYTKAILFSDPSHGKDFGAALINACSRFIFFYRKGQSLWSYSFNKDLASTGYSDILSCNDHLYALTSEHSIQIWGLEDSYPINERFIRLPTPITSIPTNLFSRRGYLVDSGGDLLLVDRIFSNCLHLHSHAIPSRIFKVYKLDFTELNWVEVTSLNNQALFIGINHSISLHQDSTSSGWHPNSIYLTKDYWDIFIGDLSYNSYDCVVFNLAEDTVKPFRWRGSGQVLPMAAWVVPNPR